MKTRSCARAGFTLVESLIALALSSSLFGMLMLSAMGFQRSFVATGTQVSAHNDQLRLTDYLARDLRSASNVTVRSDGKGVDILIPEANSNVLSVGINLPVVEGLLQGGGSGAKRSIVYYVHGGELYRCEGGTRVPIARHLSNFTVTQSGGRVIVEAGFKSQYSRDPAKAPAMKVTRAIWLRNTNS